MPSQTPRIPVLLRLETNSMKKIIYTASNGTLVVIHPTRNTYPVLEDLSDEECLERAKKDIPVDAVDFNIVDSSEIPLDRSYRGAWVNLNGKIEHCLIKAKHILKDKLRMERKPLLESLDVKFMRAIEEGDTSSLKSIKEEKQRLRDITNLPSIESAKTIEDLKKVVI